MLRSALFRTLSRASLALCLLTPPALTLAQSAAPAAPHHAGLQKFSLPYHDQPIEVQVWYPTQGDEAEMMLGPYLPRVAQGAPVVAGRHPLVVISHGTGASAFSHFLLAESLARAGFVVVGFTHPGDNFEDRSLSGGSMYFFERPRQVSRVLDAVLAHPDWQHRIDPARIGGYGHSAGGYTMAALAGAVPDPTRAATHCKTAKDDPSCALADPSALASLSSKPALRLSPDVKAEGALHDPRFAAIYLASPLSVPIAGLAPGVTPPAMRIVSAARDEVLPIKYHHARAVALFTKADVGLAAGAGHMSFMAPIDDAWKLFVGPAADDPPGLNRKAFQATHIADVTRYFQRTLATSAAQPTKSAE